MWEKLLCFYDNIWTYLSLHTIKFCHFYFSQIVVRLGLTSVLKLQTASNVPLASTRMRLANHYVNSVQ